MAYFVTIYDKGGEEIDKKSVTNYSTVLRIIRDTKPEDYSVMQDITWNVKRKIAEDKSENQ